MKKGSKLRTYKVWYSRHSAAKVRAYSVLGARRQAWEMVRGAHKYGWARGDFMRNATVERLD